MASGEEIKKSLEEWANLLERPEIAEKFEGYSKTMQFIFPDIDFKLQLIFQNKKAQVEEGFDENAEMSLEVNSDLFLGILNGEIDPMEAFMEGTLKPRGTMSDLEKLQIFIDEID
ncbi:MAG: SCP2 sterol-binding domain-containing protein [Candidatus Lokiarchaeia archaeon]